MSLFQYFYARFISVRLFMFYLNTKNNGYWNACTEKKSRFMGNFLSGRMNPWLLFFLLWGCTAQQLRNKNLAEEDTFNSLIQEKSSFLKQHAYSPVDWKPWSSEIIQEAKNLNKLIFLSIGYSSSHASHVMERGVFRDSNFVSYLNEHTIPILVDREERPDIAEYYKNFCDYFAERPCTFPLNIILLPDTKPIFGASVLRPELWNDLLLRYIRLYEQAPEEAEALATRLDMEMEQIFRPQKNTYFRLKTDLNPDLYARRLNRILSQRNKSSQDALTKFPSEGLSFFAALAANGERTSQNILEKQLELISMGGTYDHLGGGFFFKGKDQKLRYPDFEKLLVDNAQKIDLFAEAYHLSNKRIYEQILYESTDCMERDFRMDSGTYLSSWDSDSEGEEGSYYLWSHIEIDAELGAKSDLFKRTYNVSREGNWDQRQNILYRELTDEELAYAYRMRPVEFLDELDVLRQKMLAARDKRVKPHRDPHQITSWNARLAQSYIRAYRATRDEKFLSQARRLLGILEDQQERDYQRLFHILDQEHGIEFLEDYAHLSLAYLDLHQATLNDRYLLQAKEVLAYTLSRFYDARSGLFNFSFGGEDFKAGPLISLKDGIIENANAVMCEVLLKAGFLLGNNTYNTTGRKMFQVVGPLMEQEPEKYTSWAIPLLFVKEGFQLLVIKDGDPKESSEKIDRIYHPNLLYDTKFPTENEQEGSIRGEGPYFLCRMGRCSDGIGTPEEVWQRLIR